MNPACRNAIASPVKTLYCPSDGSALPGSKVETQCAQFGNIKVTLTNYKGSMGDNRMGGGSSIHQGRMPDCHTAKDCPGIFFSEILIRSPSVSSILLMEHQTQC